MHGIIYLELKKYVEARGGSSLWRSLINEVGLEGSHFLPTKVYDDSPLVQLVRAAAAATKTPVSEVLEDFGCFIVPDLAQVYGALIDKKWTLLDLIENVDKTIHRVVRMKDVGAEPPSVESLRIDPFTLEIVYRSKRKMCSLGKGIIRGLADLYKSNVSVTESTCMLSGHPECRMLVREA